MKKSALILFPVVCGLLLGGCRSRSGESTTSEPSVPSTSTPTAPTTPDPADQHVTSISLSPSKSFMAQVGDVHKFTVSHEGSPTDPKEKAVTWTVSNPNIALLEEVETTSGYFKNAQVTFLQPGKVTVTVTSNYNAQFTRSVDVTIVEKSDYIYLWNCQTGDKAKFSKIDTELPTPQIIEDDITLNGLTWHVKRYAATKDVYGSQNLQFGYGDKEGKIDFTLVNSKEIESIQVGCSSKAEVTGVDEKGYEIQSDYGSSKITIKVNDVSYIENANTEKGTEPQPITTPSRTSFESGNIVISFSESVGYIALQNILIKYTHTLKSIKLDSSGCKTTFEKDDKFDYGGLLCYANYSNDVVDHDVSSYIEVSKPDLSTLGQKTVTVTYKEGSISVQNSYSINVIEPRTLSSVTITGEPSLTCYFSGDQMSYDGLNVTATFEDAEPEIFKIPLQDQGDFTEVDVPQVASLEMNEEWTLSLKYKGILATKTFPESTFTVVVGSVKFDMMNVDLAGSTTYIDVQDETNSVNMHIAGSSEDSAKEKTGGYPAVNNKKSIIFTTLDNNTAFKSFEFTFAPYITSAGKTETGTISVKDSILKQAPFNHEIGSTKYSQTDIENKQIFGTELLKGSNAIEISFSSQSHFGVVLFKFALVSQENAIPSNITYTGALTKADYYIGEVFDPSGLTFNVNFSNNYGPVTITEPDINIIWDTLKVGDTSCSGTFLGLIVTVTGITVSDYAGSTYNLVTEDVEDFTGTYVIGCISYNSIWNGSLKTTDEMKSATNGYSVKYSSDYTSLTGDYIIDHATFKITKQESGFYRIFSSSGFCCGITPSGAFSVVKSGGYDVSISIVNGGYAVISNRDVEGTNPDKLAMIGCSKDGKYKEYSLTSEANLGIQLFKLAD